MRLLPNEFSSNRSEKAEGGWISKSCRHVPVCCVVKYLIIRFLLSCLRPSSVNQFWSLFLRFGGISGEFRRPSLEVSPKYLWWPRPNKPDVLSKHTKRWDYEFTVLKFGQNGKKWPEFIEYNRSTAIIACALSFTGRNDYAFILWLFYRFKSTFFFVAEREVAHGPKNDYLHISLKDTPWWVNKRGIIFLLRSTLVFQKIRKNCARCRLHLLLFIYRK